MTWATGILFLCRYYGWSLEYVMGLTLGQFFICQKTVNEIMEIEYGTDSESGDKAGVGEKGHSGAAGWAVATRLFPRGR